MNNSDKKIGYSIVQHRNGREEDCYTIFDNGKVLHDHDNSFKVYFHKTLKSAELDENTKWVIIENLVRGEKEEVKKVLNIQ